MVCKYLLSLPIPRTLVHWSMWTSERKCRWTYQGCKNIPKLPLMVPHTVPSLPFLLRMHYSDWTPQCITQLSFPDSTFSKGRNENPKQSILLLLPALTKVLPRVYRRDLSCPVSQFQVLWEVGFLLRKRVKTWTHFLFLVSAWKRSKKCPEFWSHHQFTLVFLFHSPPKHTCVCQAIWPNLWFRKNGDLILWKKECEFHRGGGVGFVNVHETFQIAVLNFVLQISNKHSGTQKWESSFTLIIPIGNEAHKPQQGR